MNTTTTLTQMVREDTHIRQAKAERINFRVSSAFKYRVEQAASLAGTSMTELIQESILERVMKVEAENSVEKVVLTRQAAERLLEILDQPAKSDPGYARKVLNGEAAYLET
ncbi:DUF1778 domain-containing protein [Pseudovibrio brasiliensis]|uniref:DUF1778 domain-containing protein n=1 Tax=Pseudovibrio brasiliensis TaxID=1898042 RepID=A0ABX8AWY0_9HYPH|nr:DUF1778 domain-containing protein [Pseudovibrio brasiliensis]QUS59172.1 DUF1778 domain-containing protein [Pseudovibrio brasiliensis]